MGTRYFDNCGGICKGCGNATSRIIKGDYHCTPGCHEQRIGKSPKQKAGFFGRLRQLVASLTRQPQFDEQKESSITQQFR